MKRPAIFVFPHLGEIPYTLLVTAALVFAGVSAPCAWAGGLVSGTCRPLGDKEVVLELSVGRPAPSSIIVIQHLPPGTDVENSVPRLSSYNAKKGMGKWLLRDVRPGTITLKVRSKNTLNSNGIMGEIRYRHPATGEMANVTVYP